MYDGGVRQVCDAAIPAAGGYGLVAQDRSVFDFGARCLGPGA
ncbi:MAG: hypothetical protein ACYDH5_11285 [Acidimicrobiales bacterium]